MNENEFSQGNAPLDPNQQNANPQMETTQSSEPVEATPVKLQEDEEKPKVLASMALLDKGGKYYHLYCIAEFDYYKKGFEQDFSGATHEAVKMTREEAEAEGRVTEDGTPIFTGNQVMENVMGRIQEFSSYALGKMMLNTVSDFKKSHDASSYSDNEFFEQNIQAIRNMLQSEFSGAGKPTFRSAKFAVLDFDQKHALYGDQEIFEKVLKATSSSDQEEQKPKQESPVSNIGNVAEKAKSFAENITSGKNKTANAIITAGIVIFIAIIVIVALLKK